MHRMDIVEPAGGSHKRIDRAGERVNLTQGESPMATCHDMKMDEVYTCPACGLELKVVTECKDQGTPKQDCGCHTTPTDACTFTCCGQELVKKP